MKPDKTHLALDLAHNSPLISCRFDPTGQYVFAGAQDYQICRWELATKKKTVFPAVGCWVRGMVFSRDGANLITGGYDGRLMWCPARAEKLEPARVIDAHKGWVRAVDVSPDGSLLVSVGNDKAVRLWKLDSGELVREWQGHDSHIYNVAFHPDGKHLATGDLMCHVKHWEVDTERNFAPGRRNRL